MTATCAAGSNRRHSVGKIMNYTDAEILDAVHAYMYGSEHPDLIEYRAQSLERDLAYKHIFMWSMRRACTLAHMQNAKVLDVGCGFGWQALAISMIGGNQVTANDILPSMVDGMKDCIASLKSKDTFNFSITPLLGDICDLDLPSHSFDAIYSFEAIEHVHDMGRMFDSCARLLVPGGRVLLFNDCNILSRSTRDALEITFDKRENSWEWASYLKSIRPVEHADARPFKVMRREIVEAANSNLTERQIAEIVYCSAGMLRSEIEHLARNYKPGDRLPKRALLDWCRNPDTGEYAERLFDPYQLANMLNERGLKAKVYHSFRRQPLQLLNKIQCRPLNKLLFNIKAEFAIVATAPQ